MTTPRISVAMSVYNNARFLPYAIQSILDQTERDFELLIVNDGSTDESGSIIDRLAASDSRIRAIRQQNCGLVVSLNRLIAEARAPLIARMDGDDVALPHRFAMQVAWLDSNPDVGVLGSDCRIIDEANQASPKTNHFVPTAAILDDLQTGPPMCHPSVMMRTEVVRAVGGYRPAYRHCEDYDLWLRLSEHVRMANLPEQLLLYRSSDDQVSSRHALVQKIGAAIAWEAHVERVAGRTDPTDGLAELPPIDALDDLFGRAGVSTAVRERVALGIVYSPHALKSEGLDLILDHLRKGGAREGLWRTVLRLAKIGAPLRAARLAAALVAK